jgi:hypothetical protein
MDCTVRKCCRPDGRDNIQLSVYNGKDRIHALKYIALTLPNGMLCYIGGPFPGRMNDVSIEYETDINILIEEVQEDDEDQFEFYCDKGFVSLSHIIAAHRAKK